MGRTLLNKALIQLSADGWGFTPSLVVVWPEVTDPWGMPALWQGWWQTPRGFRSRRTLQCACPCGEPLPTHASTGGPSTLAGSFGSVSCEVTASLLCILVRSKFCFCLPRLESVSPVLWKAYNHIPLFPQGQIPWGFPVPLSDPQAGKSDRGFRTFTIVRELLCYYYSPVCGSPTWQVWDLILSILCSSYLLTAASSLTLDVGYLFLVGSSVPLLMVVQ